MFFMKRLFLITWLLIGQFSLTFSQSSTDSEAFRYYKFLTKQQINVGLKIIKLGNYLSEYSEMAEKCDSFKLDRERFDTLSELFHETATIVSKAIFDIIDLHEVDSSIGLKEPVLFLFRGYAKMLGDYYPIFFSLLQNKGKIYTPDQALTIKNTYKRYIILMKDLDSQTDVIEAASSEFMIKYNFTEYDVLKDGS
jgi:hypothetical protein